MGGTRLRVGNAFSEFKGKPELQALARKNLGIDQPVGQKVTGRRIGRRLSLGNAFSEFKGRPDLQALARENLGIGSTEGQKATGSSRAGKRFRVGNAFSELRGRPKLQEQARENLGIGEIEVGPTPPTVHRISVSDTRPLYLNPFIASDTVKDGDIIQLPAGLTVQWDNPLTIPDTKAITLRGAGHGENFPAGLAAFNPAVDTIIQDNGLSTAPLLSVHAKRNGGPNALTRISNIFFTPFSSARRTTHSNATWDGGGVINFIGQNPNADGRIRFDHCQVFGLNGAITVINVLGLIDNVRIDRFTGQIQPTIFISHTKWNGGDWGDRSFSDPYVLGGPDYLFIENCWYSGQGFPTFVLGTGGARFVVRYCLGERGRCYVDGTGTNAQGGIPASDGQRGGAIACIYNNNFGGLTGQIFRFASGTGFIHNNLWTSPTSGISNWGTPNFLLRNDRNRLPTPVFGSADGANPWDDNDPNPAPLFSDLSSTAFSAGTASGTPSQTANATVDVAGTPFTPNALIGCAIVRINATTQAPQPEASRSGVGMITANTDNRITYAGGSTVALSMRLPATGGAQVPERFRVMRAVRERFDALGRFGGPVLVRDGDGNAQIPAGGGATNQVAAPYYVWLNGTATTPVGPDVDIIEGVHYKMVNPTTDGVPYTTYAYPHPWRADDPPEEFYISTWR